MFEKTFSFWQRLVQGEPATHVATDAALAVHEDRRLWLRFATEVDATVRFAEGQESKSLGVQVRDLSVGGANLHVERQFPVGQLLTIDLAGSDGAVRSTLACVVRVLADGAARWTIGCVFSRELSEADLEQFAAQARGVEGPDGRNWQRFTCERSAQYQLVADDGGQTRSAQVLNLSTNGVGLLLDHPVEAGALLNLDLVDRKGESVRSILSCVVHTTQRSDGALAVGCNFIRQLAEDELEALL